MFTFRVFLTTCMLGVAFTVVRSACVVSQAHPFCHIAHPNLYFSSPPPFLSCPAPSIPITASFFSHNRISSTAQPVASSTTNPLNNVFTSTLAKHSLQHTLATVHFAPPGKPTATITFSPKPTATSKQQRFNRLIHATNNHLHPTTQQYIQHHTLCLSPITLPPQHLSASSSSASPHPFPQATASTPTTTIFLISQPSSQHPQRAHLPRYPSCSLTTPSTSTPPSLHLRQFLNPPRGHSNDRSRHNNYSKASPAQPPSGYVHRGTATAAMGVPPALYPYYAP